MATVAQLVGRSLRLIQVIDATQPVKPQDMDSAMYALNAMLRRWEADGLALGWQPVDNPSDVLPLPEEAEQAVAACLAATLAPEYGTELMPSVAKLAIDGLNDLLRDQAVATPIRPLLDVPWPDGLTYHTGGLVNGGVVG